MSLFVWPAAADMYKHTHMAGAWDWCGTHPPKQTMKEISRHLRNQWQSGN